MSEARQLLAQMEHAEQRGDRHSARVLARAILASGERAIPAEAADEAHADTPVARAEEARARLSAQELLLRTEPDPFLFVVGILGLGLMVWLVYNYVL